MRVTRSMGRMGLFHVHQVSDVWSEVRQFQPQIWTDVQTIPILFILEENHLGESSLTGVHVEVKGNKNFTARIDKFGYSDLRAHQNFSRDDVWNERCNIESQDKFISSSLSSKFKLYASGVTSKGFAIHCSPVYSSGKYFSFIVL